MKIINVVGARPNFIKIAPLHRAFSKHDDITSIIVHTGQHYDENMSKVFFEQLEIPKPHYNLGVGGGSHTYQTAHVMLEFEKVVEEEKPDLVVVVGDVNSTVACALVAVKQHIPVAHVEAGLRSGDRTMPEEINRIVTDSISDLLFVTEQSGVDNLRREGVPEQKIHFVGNVMIDSLCRFLLKTDAFTLQGVLKTYGVTDKTPTSGEYVLVTMHRPSNVDNEAGLREIVSILKGLAKRKTVIFPVHPRTQNNLTKFNLQEELDAIDNLILLPPVGYLEFIFLMKHAFAVVTDSGGIQEETTYLGVPCLTLRTTTERPVTVLVGSNVLIKTLDLEEVLNAFDAIDIDLQCNIPPLWDGQTAERIVSVLTKTGNNTR